MFERLQKVLAHAGFGSRRKCEEMIAAGRVTVDGRTVMELGTKVDPGSAVICCDGANVRPRRHIYFLLHKPRGYICTAKDEFQRKSVLDLMKGVRERVYTVGRLDADTEGAIIVTNDGELCNRLTHPRYRVPKTYHVVVEGELTSVVIQKVQKGVWLSEGRTGDVAVRIKKRMRNLTVIDVTLREGMNREIRRIFARFGLEVVHLKRIVIGTISLGSLPIGCYRKLADAEVESLRNTRF